MKTIFMRDLNLDCAVRLTGYNLPIGYSAAIRANVSGKVDQREQVVVDFGKVKKLIKYLLDTVGPDHKLLVQSGLPQFQTNIPKDQAEITLSLNEDNTNAGTPRAVVPFDGVFYVEYDKLFLHMNELNKYVDAAVGHIAKLLNNGYGECLDVLKSFDGYSGFDYDYFVKEFGGIIGKFKTHLSVDTTQENSHILPLGLATIAALFRYSHGLPKSTSYGCQNLAHGHESVIQIKPSFMIPEDQIRKAFSFLPESGCLYFANQKGMNVGNNLTVQSDTRGEQSIDLTSGQVQVVYLDTDSTIENIIDWVAVQLSINLGLLGYRGETFDLYVSEGLQKGAIKAQVAID